MLALAWLALTLAGVSLWWLAAWGAYDYLLDLDHATEAAAVSSWYPTLLDLAQATVASLWIIGTLALLVGMGWTWRRGLWRRGAWRRRLPRFG
jgi:ABC-type antimicrobial peptide transport system permease subunit